MKPLSGRAAIITGASQGLGLAIAEHFVRAGASVALCARNLPALEEVRQKLQVLCDPGQKVFIQAADIAVPEQVDAFVAGALAAFPHLDILVNNAGIYGPLGLLETNPWDAWIEAININVLGVVYACRALLPHLKKCGHGKIINLSGGGATAPLPRVSAYAASKAAIVRFTETLALEVKENRIDVNAIAPGALATELNKKLVAAGPEVVGKEFHARMAKIVEEGGVPLSVGAEMAVWLASRESDGITGRLLSAQWDPWRNLPQHRAEIEGSDIYTLRRIVPRERGKNWGDV